MTREHPRPLLHPTDHFDWIVGSDEPGAASLLAHETSWALLHRVREDANPHIVDRVVALAAGPGIDDIAELWADASPHSLAGQLWRIYLIRRVAITDPEGTAELFRLGHTTNPTIDPVVAGAVEPVTPNAISQLCDAILRGVFAGDLASALDRAAAYCRIMARGAAALADDRDALDDAHAAELTQRSLRYAIFAEDLHVGARRWRSGSLD